MTLQELFDGIVNKTITYDRFQKWNDNVTSKVKKEAYEKAKKETTNGIDDPEVKEKLSRIEELQTAYDSLSDTYTNEKSALQTAMNELKKQLETTNKQKDNEVQRMKLDNESYRKMFLDTSLHTTASQIVRKLNLKDPEYAIHDLVRDGVLKAEEVRNDKGDLVDVKYKLDFAYEDEKTKQKMNSAFEATQKDLTPLIEGVKILASNKTASYDRIYRQYPIQEDVPIGAGKAGVNIFSGKNAMNIGDPTIDDNSAVALLIASKSQPK